MLIQRTRPDTGASEAEDNRTSFVGGRTKELGLEPGYADRAFGPYLTRTLGRKSTDRAGQVAHKSTAGALLQGDDAIGLDPHRGSELLSQKVP